jgi:hypothetical protein
MSVFSLALLSMSLPQHDVVQRSTGWCSPNVAYVVGNVTINCIGVDPRALKRLNKELSKKNEDLSKKIQEANEWAQRYHELEKLLKDTDDDLSRRAAEYLHQGDLKKAGEILAPGGWTFPDLPVMGTYGRDYIYRDVTGWESSEPVLSRIEEVDCNDLWKFAVQVPQEWYEYDTEGLCRLVETLYKRRAGTRNLLSSFRDFSQIAFPNWRPSPAVSSPRHICRTFSLPRSDLSRG